MSSFIHQDQIAERLEIARTMGLVTRFVVSPSGSSRRPEASVRVLPGPRTSDDALKNYLVRLLDGLVPEHLIVVARPLVSQDTVLPAQSEAAPVSAAA
jgi:hypothetical protein